MRTNLKSYIKKNMKHDCNEKRRIIKKYFNKENMFDYIFALEM